MSDHERWFPVRQEPGPRRARKHALADEVRALIGDVLFLDADAADEDGLADVEQRLAELRKALGELPDVRASRDSHSTEGDGHLFERSPFSGRCNALSAPLELRFDAERTYGSATYGEAYEGPPGSVHGGHVIAAFDDLLGVAQAASGTAGFTGTLSVKLLARTPLHERIDYEAGVQERSGRKVTVWGRATLGDTLLAEATGVFIAPRERLAGLPQD